VGVGVGVVSFDEFWAAYPRRAGKKDAAKAWGQIKPGRDLADRIIAGVERWNQSEQWTKDNGRFIPYPATFLRGERWNDEVTVSGGGRASPEKNYDDIPDFLGA
ncbi:MAG: hypothetical protein LUD79_01085, partial [Oscillospiraceae bacterium]|nr:hypothetical protein [Oscillospiraceae bacterium]